MSPAHLRNLASRMFNILFVAGWCFAAARPAVTENRQTDFHFLETSCGFGGCRLPPGHNRFRLCELPLGIGVILANGSAPALHFTLNQHTGQQPVTSKYPVRSQNYLHRGSALICCMRKRCCADVPFRGVKKRELCATKRATQLFEPMSSVRSWIRSTSCRPEIPTNIGYQRKKAATQIPYASPRRRFKLPCTREARSAAKQCVKANISGHFARFLRRAQRAST